jgi:hypothetical protein
MLKPKSGGGLLSYEVVGLPGPGKTAATLDNLAMDAFALV